MEDMGQRERGMGWRDRMNRRKRDREQRGEEGQEGERGQENIFSTISAAV